MAQLDLDLPSHRDAESPADAATPTTAVYPGSLIALAVALMAIGLVMVSSATMPLDRSMLDGPLWRNAWGRQACFVLGGLVVLGITALATGPLLAREVWRRRLPVVFFAVVALLLVAVLLPGVADERRGSQRWLHVDVGTTVLGFQPSEFAKLALVGLLAAVFCERKRNPGGFRHGFLPAAAALAVCVALVGKEDFGTALIIAGVGAMMMLVAGCRWLHLLLIGSVGACGMSVLLLMAPYRLARLTAFMDIWQDPRGHGYQPVQSLVTIASGGWTGTGLGAGVQKLGYLPEAHTDFVFAVICEETGLLGACLVIALYLAFIVLGLRVMLSARTPFERLLAFGLTATLGLQAALNIAVVTVMTPTTGISLPLVSAGGSGLLMYCVAIGLLVAIARRAMPQRAATTSSDSAADPELPIVFRGAVLGEARA